MAFITGILAIDASASALNMGEGEETTATVKAIHAGMYTYPYVSAQAFRSWLRRTLQTYFPQWQSATIHAAGAGKKQQAFTEGDPIQFWDDDLLGYMRAQKDEEGETRTRISPFRTSTLVALAPVEVVRDYGVMARQEGNPVLHGHEFYRTALRGLFSLDLRSAGTFSAVNRAGYRNLGASLEEKARQAGLEHLQETKSYRLPFERRVERVQTLLYGLGRLEGGARQTLHYTDVSPAFVMAAVTRGGNHIFGRVLTAERGEPAIHRGALTEALITLRDDMLSGVYVGRAQGFMDEADAVLAEYGLQAVHPREALDALAAEVALHPEWWE